MSGWNAVCRWGHCYSYVKVSLYEISERGESRTLEGVLGMQLAAAAAAALLKNWVVRVVGCRHFGLLMCMERFASGNRSWKKVEREKIGMDCVEMFQAWTAYYFFLFS